MNKLLVCLIAALAIGMMAEESNAQFYRGGSGFSVGFGNGFNSFGRSGFNRGFGRSSFGGFGGSGVRINVGGGGFNQFGGFNRGFYGGGVPYRSYRPVYRSSGFYGGGFSRGGCGY